jgi:hypothetical protein
MHFICSERGWVAGVDGGRAGGHAGVGVLLEGCLFTEECICVLIR